MNVRDIMEGLSKEDLVDLVLEYSDNGYFPLEPFLLKADYAFTSDDLKEIWESVYEKAREYEDQKSDLGADLLRDVAELGLTMLKRFRMWTSGLRFCRCWWMILPRQVKKMVLECIAIPSGSITK